MIKCRLNILLAERRMNVAELHRLTGVSRTMLYLMSRNEASRIDMDALEKVCRCLGCSVGDLFELAE